VLLDLDETLIPDEDATAAALLATAARGPVGARAAALARAVRASARTLWRTGPSFAYCNAIGISASEGLWGDLDGDDPRLRELAAWAPTYRQSVWADGLAEVGVADDALAAALAAAFPVERAARIALFPEVDAVLRRLAATRRLAIVTNGAPRLQRAKIAAAGLADRGMAIVVSGEIGFGKPDRRAIEAALAALGAAPAEAVMVGDNPERDVAGARAAGVAAVWVNRFGRALGPDEARPDATIGALDQLEPLL
jgi:putative hydrolase of the HAD superfamily